MYCVTYGVAYYAGAPMNGGTYVVGYCGVDDKYGGYYIAY